MAHFLGADGAAKFLSALQSDPAQSAAAILPKAAAANHGIFYDASGPRSVSGVMALMRGKVSSAMNGAGPMPAASSYASTQIASASPAGGPLQREFNALAAQVGTQASSSGRTSMADTLRSAFGAGGNTPQGGAPDFVRTAYAKLQAFNL